MHIVFNAHKLAYLVVIFCFALISPVFGEYIDPANTVVKTEHYQPEVTQFADGVHDVYAET